MNMHLNEEKLKRLVSVSRMYYEENKTQAEIAKRLSVSRPMVSKLLTEAKTLGIVTIHITEATSFRQIMEERLKEKYGLKRVAVVPMERDEERTDKTIVAAAWQLACSELGKTGCLGVGWGSLIGRIADYLEERGGTEGAAHHNVCREGTICPLIGNAAASYRSYHPNELVRILAGRTGLQPAYIYGPAIAESESEKAMYENTDSFRQLKELWHGLSAALVNVSNYPSSPDMATALRFGTRLAEEKAAGHILSYFYNREGRFIGEDSDCMLRISLEELAGAKRVLALCASGVKPAAAEGALKTGVVSDIILNEKLASELLQTEQTAGM